MRKRSFTPAALVAAALILALGLNVSTRTIGAQGTVATPSTPENAGTTIARHPAHIHAGTCAELGDVVLPLNDLQAASRLASPVASPSQALPSTPAASPVRDVGDLTAQSGTVVEASLDDILSDEHAINVHKSAEEIQSYIACGDLTGTPTDGELTIDLQELNSSGYVGEARLADNGDGTTTVHVSVFPADADAPGTPAATPAG